jgi:tyrosyl-tRNA synthetase
MMENAFEIIKRGCVEIIEEGELKERLKSGGQKGKELRVKCGFDPSAPDIHLGHYVLLKKLREFQELGHKVLLLIGDFTGMIGDPSGQTSTRRALTKEEVKENAKTYERQVFKVLKREKTEIVFNSEWLGKLSPYDIVNLCGKWTVARMLEREDFKMRYQSQKPISIHEFLYPLFQAYDSVALNADIEIGGADQKFNFMITREIQKEFGQPPEVVLTLPLLEGLDGKRKMSKSYGNYVGIEEAPDEMFGKIMSIPDFLITRYMRLLTSIPEEKIKEIERGIIDGSLNPRDAKLELAFEITSTFHGEEQAKKAKERFEKVFSRREIPEEMEEFSIPLENEIWLPKLLKELKVLPSTSEGIRMAKQGGIDVNGVKVDPNYHIREKGIYVLKIGKRKFIKLKVI